LWGGICWVFLALGFDHDGRWVALLHDTWSFQRYLRKNENLIIAHQVCPLLCAHVLNHFTKVWEEQNDGDFPMPGTVFVTLKKKPFSHFSSGPHKCSKKNFPGVGSSARGSRSLTQPALSLTYLPWRTCRFWKMFLWLASVNIQTPFQGAMMRSILPQC
jgi:hypothetical protein